LDFTNGQDKIWLEDYLWDGTPPAISTILAGVKQTEGGVILEIASGTTLEVFGVFDPSILADDILFI
jgi:hypothetical protein